MITFKSLKLIKKYYYTSLLNELYEVFV